MISPSAPPADGMLAADVVDTIVRIARSREDAVVLEETSGRRLRGAEFARQVELAAAGLVRAGMRPGDRVLFAVRPRFEAIVLILAILRVGGVLVAADLGMSDAVFAARMAVARPRWVVAEAHVLWLSRWRLVRALLRRRGLALPPLASVRDCQLIRVRPGWLGRLPQGPSAVPPRAPDPEAAAFVVFTSGTTAAPRAVVHTQASLGASVHVLQASLDLTPDDVVYSGDLHAIVPALLAGARVVIPRSRRHPLERYGITHFFGTPADVLDLPQLPATVRMLLLGAAPVDRAFLGRVRSRLPAGTQVWCVYAMTEMLPVARISMDEKLAATDAGDLVGTPFPGVRARLADDGELLLRGPHLCQGYLGEPAMQEHATGDLASIDAAGRIVLLGRKKDMIIRGHDNIYPSLHEPMIAALPGVRRCSLVGVYDAYAADERIVLVVEPEPGQDAAVLAQRLRVAVRDCIDAAAQPDEIVCMPIPLGGRSRKVDKRALLERLRGRVG